MTNPAPDTSRPAPAFTSSDRLAVPLSAVQLLRSCIEAGKDGQAANDQIRAALTPICEEAHRAQAMPEHLLVSIKELCHSLPEYERMHGARERGLFLETVVKLAIEEYYRG